jgi:hypothetical protein
MMKEVMKFIEYKQQKFAQLQFFQFLRDSNIDPIKRISFAPEFAFFVMSFGDLNKYAFRVEPTCDAIQFLVNQHTYEDDSHWLWFLEDIKKLEFNTALTFNDALKLLWSEKTKTQRQVVNQLFQYTFQATPIQKLIAIEAIEATAEVFLSTTRQVAKELQIITQKEYKYFGDSHWNLDSNHTINTNEFKESILAQIQMTDETYQQAFDLVEKIFTLFTSLYDELLITQYATDSVK